MRTLIAAVSILTATISNTALAECRLEENVDQITMTSTTSVFCPQNDQQFVVFHCLSNNDFVIGFFTNDYVGGDNTTVLLRGDAQSESYSFQGVVGNDGQWFRAPSNAFAEIIEHFQNSSQVFVRYLDYRDVVHDLTFSAVNFTSLSSRLPCMTPITEAADLNAEMEARGCSSSKEGWVCPE